MRKLTQSICTLALIAAACAANAVAPTPAPPQSEPIALVGAIIHVGDGTVIGDGVITFDEGVITAVGSAADGIDTSGHLVIDVQGSHIYPGLVLPNSTLGLLEIANIRATDDVVEEGDINASVRSAIAYNTDSELIPATRFNGILTAQVTPEGGLISGLSSIFMLDAWNWEDAALRLDDGQHMHWPGFKRNRRNPDTGRFERVDNDDYQAQVEMLHALFRDAVSYTGEPLNLNLAAMQGLFDGSGKLFLHADGAREIISGVRFARSYGVRDIVLVGGAEALQVKDLLLAESIPVIYERIHALPGMEWHDVDAPFRMPFLLREAGLEVGIGGGDTELQRQRNLPFYAGTAAAYGFDREAALGLVTLNNARILGVDDRVGSLKPGKDATLFISVGDALDMRTSQLLGAYIQGRDIDLFGTQQELYERFREKYSNRVE